MKDIFDKPGKKRTAMQSWIRYPKRMEKIRKSSGQIGESRQNQKLQRHSKKQARQAFRQYRETRQYSSQKRVEIA